MNTVQILPGREKSVKNRHPWIFRSGIKPIPAKAGEIVLVQQPDQKMAGLAFYNPHSQISLRFISFNPETEINRSFWLDKIKTAIEKRTAIRSGGSTDSCRLIFGEADGLPGLIVDQFADVLSVQFLTAGMENLRTEILSILQELLSPRSIIEKSDQDMRALEGLKLSEGLLTGEAVDKVIIQENGLQYEVDFSQGQKTGYYLDQRDNRLKTAAWTKGKKVLDAFCYSGGFSLNAWKAGAAHLTCVDSSGPALELLRRNMTVNKVPQDFYETVEADAFEYLRQQIRTGSSYDMIILDPPKLAPTKAHLEKAMRAYKDINLQAFKLLKRGGILATFSCSGGISTADLKMVCAWAALDAGRTVTVLEVLSQPPDHPVSLHYPESEYLKGLILHVE